MTLERGRSVLAYHGDPKILRAVARLAAARPAKLTGDSEIATCKSGEIRWRGAALDKKTRPGDRMALAREIALVDTDSKLLLGTRLIETLALDLEYNQGLFNPAARKEALETLDRLGLADLADTPQERLFGPERGLALMALALSRRPTLFIIDRPRALLDDDGFRLVWRAISEELKSSDRAALILDYAPGLWPSGIETDDELSLSSANKSSGRQSAEQPPDQPPGDHSARDGFGILR